jgi:hypothetical protein
LRIISEHIFKKYDSVRSFMKSVQDRDCWRVLGHVAFFSGFYVMELEQI